MELQLQTPIQARIFLVDWTHCIEDFLENVGIGFESFLGNTTGGWLFNYVEALQYQQVTAELCFFTRLPQRAGEYFHQPTGARVHLLPVPSIYRYLRRWVQNPYAADYTQSGKYKNGLQRLMLKFCFNLLPYTATPIRRFSALVRSRNPQAIICQEYENPRFDWLVRLGRYWRRPVFAVFQGGSWQITGWEKMFRYRSMHLAAGLLVASAVERNRIQQVYQVPTGRIAPILNPINLQPITEVWEDALPKNPLPTVVWHGRVHYYRKGLDTLLAAWKILGEKYPNHTFQLELLGSGLDTEQLQKEIGNIPNRNIKWQNEYVNDRKQIYQFLIRGHLYVFPSRHEGFALAPLEAMACGLPLVAGNAPGIADLIPLGLQQGGIQFLENDASDLAEKIHQFLSNLSFAEKVGEAARKRAIGFFSLEAIGMQVVDFIFKKQE